METETDRVTRSQRLRDALTGEPVDALLVGSAENRYYLTGFRGTAGYALVTPEQQVLITDFRYREQAEAQASGWQIVNHEGNLWATLTQVLQEEGISAVGFEANRVYYQTVQTFQQKTDLDWHPLSGVVEKLRMVKEADEVDCVERACRMGDKAFASLLDQIEPGKTERQLALQLEFNMKRQGAEDLAFDTIVASGPRGSLPHGLASERQIEQGDLITFDFGCVYRGYHSDMTRTIAVGQVDQRQRDVYERVREAQQIGVDRIRPGISGREADRLVREVIDEAGYGDYFGHSTGHGVGLEIHEAPVLSKRKPPAGDTELEEGMVVTIEPGIYQPDWGGVRIEDTVVLTPDGCRPLTQTDKKLMIV